MKLSGSLDVGFEALPQAPRSNPETMQTFTAGNLNCCMVPLLADAAGGRPREMRLSALSDEHLFAAARAGPLRNEQAPSTAASLRLVAGTPLRGSGLIRVTPMPRGHPCLAFHSRTSSLMEISAPLLQNVTHAHRL